jgi:hypothetical protein
MESFFWSIFLLGKYQSLNSGHLLPLEPHPQPFLLQVFFFQIRSQIYAQAGLDFAPPRYAFHLAGMTGECHHTQLLLIEVGLSNFLQGLASNHAPLNLHLLVARITGVSHRAWLALHYF